MGWHGRGLSLISNLGGLPLDLLHRHDVQPPLHHPVRLGEEPVPANIDAVSFVIDGSRDPTDVVAFLKYNRLDLSPSQQFKGRREASRARTNDDGALTLLS